MTTLHKTQAGHNKTQALSDISKEASGRVHTATSMSLSTGFSAWVSKSCTELQCYVK